MKQNKIIILFSFGLLLFSFKGFAHETRLKILESSIETTNNCVRLSFKAISQNLGSNYELDICPRLTQLRFVMQLPYSRIVGHRRMIALKRANTFHSLDKKNSHFLNSQTVSNHDTLNYVYIFKRQNIFNNAHIQLDIEKRGCCSFKSCPLVDLGKIRYIPQKKHLMVRHDLPSQPVKNRVETAAEKLIGYENFIRPDSEFKDDIKNHNYDNGLTIYFVRNHYELDKKFLGNEIQLNRLIRAIKVLKQDKHFQITKVLIVGSSSVEGTVDINKRFAEKRISAFESWLLSQNISQSSVTAINLGENWKSLNHQILVAPQVPYRDDVLKILERICKSKSNELELMKLHNGIPYLWMLNHLFYQQRGVQGIKIYYHRK